MINNPFDITKAVDYTDQELYDYWVDLNQKKGFNHVMKPTTLMPMIIIGSKGSGKTHIMKYYSYELQKIRCEKENSSIEEGLAKEKFYWNLYSLYKFLTQRYLVEEGSLRKFGRLSMPISGNSG